MENNYDKWSREELLYEVKRLSVELEKVKQLNRLTDDRFVGDGFYQPKTKEERKEIQAYKSRPHRQEKVMYSAAGTPTKP